MSPLTGPLLAAAALLASAGVRKLVDPGPTRLALRTARLPGTPLLARLIGAGELAVALLVLLRGGSLAAALLAAAYLAFAGFTALVIERGGRNASCGCFGSAPTPVSRWHVGVNLVIAAVAVAGVAWPPASLPDAVADTPAAGLPLLGFVVLLAWLLQVLLTQLPDLWAAAKPPRRTRAVAR